MPSWTGEAPANRLAGRRKEGDQTCYREALDSRLSDTLRAGAGGSLDHPGSDVSSKGHVGPCSCSPSPEHYFPSAPTGRGVMRWPC